MTTPLPPPAADENENGAAVHMQECRNVYMVWSESLCEDGWRYEYYMFIAAKTPSGAKYYYADFGGWGDEVFQKQPDHFRLHCHLVERDVPYRSGEIYSYEEVAGVDLIMAGIISPMWMTEYGASMEHDYRRWNGFRKPKAREMEVYP